MTDELVPMPEIKGMCSRCGVTEADVYRVAVVVSPNRIAHFGTNCGDTACGVDATGSKWWWPL